MRDPARIPKLMGLLQSAWQTDPDMRLGQLLSCVINNDEDVFNVEDDVLHERLKRWRADRHGMLKH